MMYISLMNGSCSSQDSGYDEPDTEQNLLLK